MKCHITRRCTGAGYVFGFSTSFASFEVLVFHDHSCWSARPVILVVMWLIQHPRRRVLSNHANIVTMPNDSPPLPDATDHHFTPVRFGVFVLNLAVSWLLVLCLLMLLATGLHTHAMTFFGTVAATITAAIYGHCEWISGYRNSIVMERRLGWANLLIAGLLTLGMINTVGQGLRQATIASDHSLTLIVLIGALVIAYLISCGWMRLRWTRAMTTGEAAERHAT